MRHALLLASLLLTTTGCYGLLASALQGDGDGASRATGDDPHVLEMALYHRERQLALPAAVARTAVDVAPVRPDWCAGFVAGPGPVRFDTSAHAGAAPQLGDLVLVARAACERPDDPGRQAVVAALRGTYLAYFGITEAEDHAHLAARAAIDPSYAWDAACAGIAPAVAATAEGAALQQLYRCGDRPDAMLEALDRDRAASPLVTLAARQAYAELRAPLLATALAAVDGDAGTRDAALQALAARGVDPALREYVYVGALTAEGELQAAAREVAALAATLPELPAALAAARTGWQQWQRDAAPWQAELAALARARSAVEQGAAGAIPACTTQVRAALSATLRGVTSDDELVGRLATLVPAQALDTLAWCNAMDAGGLPRFGIVLGALRSSASLRAHRGPRAAAVEAVRAQLGALGAHAARYQDLTDDLEAHGWPALVRRQVADQVFDDVIATLATAGDVTTLTFPSHKLRVRATECRDTDQLHSIEADGTVHYKRACRAGAMTTVVEQHPAVTVEAEVGARLRRGQAVRVMDGWLVAAYGKGGRPVMLLGAPL